MFFVLYSFISAFTVNNWVRYVLLCYFPLVLFSVVLPSYSGISIK
uniref:Uncharacterized protein n=1 Tax=Lepeophtheirus salmonis TaxID=72036 RepID=A0A0K2UGT2_LEPSM